ncbi:MAG: hypothetical protein RQ741_06115, partial [Wenzhouxiangellaceae bacterium]|nr:hypothetical protein [Wenzhouxiangellaceae bacterium]
MTQFPFSSQLTTNTVQGRARAAALQGFEPPPEPMEWVEYRSAGTLLIIGPADEAWPLARALGDSLECAVLATAKPATAPESAPPATTAYGNPVELSGHLGAFTLSVEDPSGRVHKTTAVFGADRAAFDLVLDLNRKSALARQILPPGYIHASTAERRAAALDELPQMVGEFQKPRFFA